MPPSTTKSFKNFQPYLYWAAPLSGHEGKGDSLNVNGFISFSFNTGYKGSNVVPNYLYILPMFKGKAVGSVPAGALVYDAAQDVTWLADANLAASFRFDFDTIYINRDGAMDHATAVQFVNAMNGYNGGKGYLGQTHWELPPADTIDATCTATHNPKSVIKQSFGYNCTGSALGRLYYGLLKKQPGESVRGDAQHRGRPVSQHSAVSVLELSRRDRRRRRAGRNPRPSTSSSATHSATAIRARTICRPICT